MLSAAPFYYQTIRKNVIAFGDIFKDIMLLKYNANNRVEIDRRIVPLVYMPKENYISRLNNTQDEDLPNKVEIVLPTMSFEITKIAYDPTRKLQSSLQNFNTISGTNSQIATQYVGVPYNINFSLYIYIRNIDDGLQIIEQILPFFTPDWTTTVDLIPEINEIKDIPIIMNTVHYEDNYDSAFDKRRAIVWTLDLTLKGFLYGPVKSNKIIKFVDVTFYIPPVPDGQLQNAVGNTKPSERVTVQPGLDANGNPTSNISITIPYNQIQATDNFGYIDIIYNENQLT